MDRLHVFDCDMVWVMAMNNRIFMQQLISIILKESPYGSEYYFGGAAIIGNANLDMSSLYDTVPKKNKRLGAGESLDLILNNPKKKLKICPKSLENNFLSIIHRD